MLKVDVANTDLTIDQLLNQVENGEEVVFLRHGKPIARLSALSNQPRPLASRRELRASQPQTSISTLETIQSLRQEARY